MKRFLVPALGLVIALTATGNAQCGGKQDTAKKKKELEQAVTKADKALKQAREKIGKAINEGRQAVRKAYTDYRDALHAKMKLERKLRGLRFKSRTPQKRPIGKKRPVDKKRKELEDKITQAQKGIATANKNWFAAVKARNEFSRQAKRPMSDKDKKKLTELKKAVDDARKGITKAMEHLQQTIHARNDYIRKSFRARIPTRKKKNDSK